MTKLPLSDSEKLYLDAMSHYLWCAMKFFEGEYAVSTKDCKISLMSNFDGAKCGKVEFKAKYMLDTNQIVIYGGLSLDPEDLVDSIFHELIHWRQAIVQKSLYFKKYVYQSQIQQLKDWIQNSHREPLVMYNDVVTNDIEYLNKPHEIEARLLSARLMERWLILNGE